MKRGGWLALMALLAANGPAAASLPLVDETRTPAIERLAGIRSALRMLPGPADTPEAAGADQPRKTLAQWLNWNNWGNWGNWNNWSNWGNWGNWRNF